MDIRENEAEVIKNVQEHEEKALCTLKYYYAELLKETSPTNQRGRVPDVLSKAFFVWGNYDFIRFSMCPIIREGEIENPESGAEAAESSRDIADTQELAWLKREYERGHIREYDGVEHQPVYFCGCESGQDLIGDFVKADSEKPVPGEERSIYQLSLLQMDILDNPERFRKPLPEVIRQLETDIQKQLKKSDTAAFRIYFNLGESDFALLTKAEDLGRAMDVLMAAQEALPVVKVCSMIIFPYRYESIAKVSDDNIEVLIEDVNRWMRKGDTPIELETQAVTDYRHQGIYGKDRNDWKYIFGDYDVLIRASNEKIIKNYLLHVKKKDKEEKEGFLYRYSKTTPVIPGSMLDLKAKDQSRYPRSKQEEIAGYQYDVQRLANAIHKVTDNETIPKKVRDIFDSSEITLINLYNYFIRLHETRYAPDVYYCMRFFFEGIAQAFDGLSKFISYEGNAPEETNYAVLQMSYQIKMVISALQKFLGIVALSPRNFSESKGSYMRSANGALKLIIAYHEAIHIMQDVVLKIPVPDGPDAGGTKLVEREAGAFILLPGREDDTFIDDYFKFLSPRYHASVINAGFKHLFDPKCMLFLIAHEVGHSMGERLREQRKKILVEAFVRYLSFKEVFIVSLLYPNTAIFNQCNDNGYYGEEVDALDEIHRQNGYPDTEPLNNAVITLCDKMSENLLKKINDDLKDVPEDEDSFLVKQHFAYLNEMKKVIGKEFLSYVRENKIPEDCLDNAAEELAKWNWRTYEKAADKIDRYVSVKLNAKMMNENKADRQKETIQWCYSDLQEEQVFKCLTDIGVIFGDIYADIFAIRFLGIKKKEYALYLLNSKLEVGEYYGSVQFLVRFYVVMKKVYGEDVDAVLKAIEDKISVEEHGQEYENIKDLLMIISEFACYFTVKFEEYVDLIEHVVLPPELEDTKPESQLSMLRNFCNSPERYVYTMWVAGIKRGDEMKKAEKIRKAEILKKS